MLDLAIHRADLSRDFEIIRPLLELLNGRQTTEEALDEFCRCRDHIYAAYASDRLCGFASLSFPYWNRVGIMDHMVVVSDFRRHGVGRSLYHSIESVANTNGLRILTVQTATWNTDAISFYEAVGFRPRGTFAEYMGPANDLLWLDKTLEPISL